MKTLLKALAALRRVLEAIELGSLLLLLALLLSLSFLQVILRQTQSGWVWADVLIRHLVLWIGMLGAVLAASRSRHIRIDALGRLLKGWPARWTGMLLDGLSAWICLRLALAARDFVLMTREFGDLAEPLDWPAWPLQAVIPIGFALMALHFLLNLPLRLDPAYTPESGLPVTIGEDAA
ncbi:MAG: TRAP transporter small permease subunit [Candidatus Delongbacteria bacterium]